MNKPNLDEAIKASVKLIESHEATKYSVFRRFDRFYIFTTEVIGAYLEQEKYNKNRALTVLSSGDHVFNLVHEGITTIDAFDINELSYYMFWLKLAAIMSLSYDEYMEAVAERFYLGSFFKFGQFLYRIKNNLPNDVFDYFCYIMDYLQSFEQKFFEERYRKEKKHSESLENSAPVTPSIALSVFIPKLIRGGQSLGGRANIFYRSEEEYNRLKKQLEALKIEFYFDDARKLPGKLKEKYDLILLSNITDYLKKEGQSLSLEEFREFIDSFYNILDDEGLLINYFYKDLINEKAPLIQNSTVSLEKLGKENVVSVTKAESYYRVRKKSQT